MSRRLYRSDKEKMLFGVAGGIAEYFELDPVIIRLLFILFTFFGGFGFIIYIAGIILMPKRPLSDYYNAYHMPPSSAPFTADATPKPQAGSSEEFTTPGSESSPADSETAGSTSYAYSGNQQEIFVDAQFIKPKREKSAFFGYFLIVVGAFFLLSRLFDSFNFLTYFPLLLVGFGSYLLFTAFRGWREVQ